ncbi:MAG: nucleoid-associated protein [Flavobacteriaceae bacterium]|nr:nucleoid-associated protein [Flavobacteriaceae bacterium]
MLNLYNAHIELLSIHRVGNKSRSEGYFLSEKPYAYSDELAPLLKEFFLKPFRDKEHNYYHFAHETDLEFHTLSELCKQLFAEPKSFQDVARKITLHLYDQSQHPHIKSGEVYVAYFSDLQLDNQKIDGLGIFKSELKHEFLQFEEKENNLNLMLQQGVSLNKLDKGCLIFNTNQEDGYKVLSVDANRYDSKYWLESFLAVAQLHDDNFLTKNYLKFCKDFAKDVVLPAEDKKEEVMFLNKSVNYFAKNDDFEESKFINEVIQNPDLIPEFKNYKVERGPKYSIEDLSEFSIANKAVSVARKNMRGIINLDTNIQIKMDFINSDSAEKFVEKGWDEEKQMYYYLVYFNKEQRS